MCREFGWTYYDIENQPREFIDDMLEVMFLNNKFERKKYGGCKDCEFFDNCHGGCPSQAINGDWRNRTELCDLYYDLFSKVRNMQTVFGCSKNMSKVKNFIL